MSDKKDTTRLSQEELEAASGGAGNAATPDAYNSLHEARDYFRPAQLAQGKLSQEPMIDAQCKRQRSGIIPDAGSKKGFEKLLWRINRFFGK